MERPNKGPLAELSEEDFDRFVRRLGMLAFNSIAGAAFARHGKPLDTAADYLDVLPGEDPPAALAKEFWRDLARRRLGTAALAKKWFMSTPQDLATQAANLLDEET